MIADGLALYVIFLVSTSLHEASHAWAALKGGDSTAHDGGQVTLDPIPHIRREPFGMVVLPLISVVMIGWPLGFASAPYDPVWARRHPERSAWMALAGPGANLFLALCAAMLINVGLFAGVFVAPDSIGFADVTMAATSGAPLWEALAYILGAVFALNLLLAVFNMLPVPPMDGSSAVMLLLPAKAIPGYQDFISSNPYLGWIGLFVAWQVFDFVFDPVFTQSLNMLYLLHGVSYF